MRSEAGLKRLLGRIPGWSALAQKTPALREPEGLARAILTFGASLGASHGQMRRLDRWGAPGTLAGHLFTFATAMRLGWGLFRSGPQFRQRYGDLAYQEALFRYLLPFAGSMVAGFAHVFTAPGERQIPLPAALVPGLYLLATGVGIWRRTIHTLGVDTAALVYVYFPHEGRRVYWDAYRLLRHPLYAAVTRVLLGAALLRGRLRGLALALLTLGWFHLWIKLEEGELVQRFGQSYEAYRQGVPAIIPDSLEAERRLLHVIVTPE